MIDCYVKYFALDGKWFVAGLGDNAEALIKWKRTLLMVIACQKIDSYEEDLYELSTVSGKFYGYQGELTIVGVIKKK